MEDNLDANYFNRFGADQRPGLLGIVFNQFEKDYVLAEFTIREAMLTQGILRAGIIVCLANTACGYGCLASLPDGASSFCTIELNSNFTGSAREGVIVCEARDPR